MTLNISQSKITAKLSKRGYAYELYLDSSCSIRCEYRSFILVYSFLIASRDCTVTQVGDVAALSLFACAVSACCRPFLVHSTQWYSYMELYYCIDHWRNSILINSCVICGCYIMDRDYTFSCSLGVSGLYNAQVLFRKLHGDTLKILWTRLFFAAPGTQGRTAESLLS